MQRLSSTSSSEFDLKSGLEYKVSIGYAIYDTGDFNIANDLMTDSGWQAEQPLYWGESAEIVFYWWNIDSAAGVLSTAIAAVVLLNAL